MKDADYPSLYRSADAASLAAQRQYVGVFRLDLILLVFAALLALGRSGTSLILADLLGIGAALALVGSIAIKWILKVKGYDSLWFNTRAVAESVKTATWRYMVAVKPFEYGLPDAVCDERFCSELEAIQEGRQNVRAYIATFSSTPEHITETMRINRRRNLVERKAIYLNERLQEQMVWYQNKAKLNARAVEYSFWIVMTVQGLAVVTGILQMQSLGSPNFIAVLVSVAATITGWSEMKDYRNLSNSYSLASDDLASAAAVWQHITDEATFQSRVIQTEEAISREHTMWVAKRIF